MVVGEIWTRNARRHGDRLAVVFESTRHTFAEHDARVNRLAHALLRRGLSKGDRVAALMDNGHQYLELLGAAAKAGLVLVSLNVNLKDELRAIAGNAEPQAVVVSRAHLDKVDPAWASVRTVLCPEGAAVSARRVSAEGYEPALAAAPAEQPGVAVEPDDPLLIYYTSGTTGLPKGACSTHRAVLANAVNVVYEAEVRSTSIGLTVHPLFFTAPINTTVVPHFYVGSPVVVLRKYSPEAFMDVVERERPTHVMTVPTMVIRLLEHPDHRRRDLSSLTHLIYGSAAMPVDRLRRALETWGPIMFQVYGLSETTCLCTILRREEHVLEGRESRRLASCGREMVNCEVRVVRDDGTPVQRNGEEVGEIVIRGDNLMRGYWRNPEKTAEGFRGGWFLSGDLATVDPDGFIYIVDRKKDLIITGGINVFPREVEEVLYAHHAVQDAAVVGVPDPEWGEAIKAFVVLRPGRQATAAELIEHCRRHLAGFKKPREVEFVEEIPRTATGKTLRRELRQR